VILQYFRQNIINIDLTMFIITIYILLFLILFSSFTSCTHLVITENVYYVLELSGQNTGEPEKVLTNYNRFWKDGLKFNSACFLIANIYGKSAYHFEGIQNHDSFFMHVLIHSKQLVNKRKFWISLVPVLSNFNFNVFLLLTIPYEKQN